MTNYQIESLKLASKVLNSCRARIALEDAIFEGPHASRDTMGTALGIALGLVGLATWFMVLMAIAQKL